MLTLKTLTGDLVSLPVTTEDEYKSEYIKQYVKPEYQPFVTLHIEEGTLLVNLHPMLPQLERDINWGELSKNTAAISFLEEHLDKVSWEELSANPAAVPLLKKHRDKINYKSLSRNQSLDAEELFLEYSHLIDWHMVARNHPRANLLVQGDYESFVQDFCYNPNVRPEWIENHLDLLYRGDWSQLSSKTNMISLLEKYPDQIHFDLLSSNPGAAEFLLKNKSSVNSSFILYNPSPLINEHIKEFPLPAYINSGTFFMDAPGIIAFLDDIPPEDILWDILCYNPHPKALQLLEDNLHRVRDHKNLVYNKGAKKLILKYIDQIIESTPICYRSLSLMTIYSLDVIMCPDTSNF